MLVALFQHVGKQLRPPFLNRRHPVTPLFSLAKVSSSKNSITCASPLSCRLPAHRMLINYRRIAGGDAFSGTSICTSGKWQITMVSDDQNIRYPGARDGNSHLDLADDAPTAQARAEAIGECARRLALPAGLLPAVGRHQLVFRGRSCIFRRLRSPPLHAAYLRPCLIRLTEHSCTTTFERRSPQRVPAGCSSTEARESTSLCNSPIHPCDTGAASPLFFFALADQR